jgi:hypothetical protein
MRYLDMSLTASAKGVWGVTLTTCAVVDHDVHVGQDALGVALGVHHHHGMHVSAAEQPDDLRHGGLRLAGDQARVHGIADQFGRTVHVLSGTALQAPALPSEGLGAWGPVDRARTSGPW